MNVRKPSDSRPGNRVQMGSSSKDQPDDIDDAGFDDCKELSYKLFQHRDYKVRNSNGEFVCPFCACQEDDDRDYTHLLQHAIRLAEGSLSRKQRAKHLAMARFLAFDLADEVKTKAVSTTLCDTCDLSQKSPSGRKRSKPCGDSSKCSRCNRGPPTPTRKQRVAANLKLALAEKREKEALDKVRELKTMLDEMNDQFNALIAKDRSSNDELQGVRKELIEGLSEIQPNKRSKGKIGIKKFGELDPEDFISELHNRFFPQGEIVIKGVELCTLWQEKIKDPHWYPFQIVEDASGIPKRLVRNDDILLRALKEEWGRGIHDAVVEALTDIQEHNPSGCYMVPELWNFPEGRKAALSDFVRHIFQLGVGKAKPKPRSKPEKNSKW